MSLSTPPGRVFWITGFSGTGKSTLGRLLCQHLRQQGVPALMLDGDDLRQVFGNDLGHTRADRQRSAMRNARLCRFLANQGMDVVCATISLFHACQQWNREHIPRYHEIYLKAALHTLQARDPHGLYAAAARGERNNVVGLDLTAELPQHPDLILENDGHLPPGQLLAILCAHFSL